jgi:hypothetical protein
MCTNSRCTVPDVELRLAATADALYLMLSCGCVPTVDALYLMLSCDLQQQQMPFT